MSTLISLVVLCVGVAMVAWATNRNRRRANPEAQPLIGHSFKTKCKVCQQDLTVHRSELTPLSTVELALAVRIAPHVSGRKLAEYICPHCETSHCFVTDSRELTYVGANLYSPQPSSNRCGSCRRPIRKPVWAKGAYDGRLHEASTVPADFGLVCPKCGTVDCVECCTRASKQPPANRIYTCPQCGHTPLDTVFHT